MSEGSFSHVVAYFMSNVGNFVFCVINENEPAQTKRKGGNAQESIKLPNTFRPRHQRERRTHLKQLPHNHNFTRRKPKGQFHFPKLAKRLSKLKQSPRHACRNTQLQK